VFFIAFVVYLVSSGFKRTAYDAYALMASGWLDGHLWILNPGPSVDAVLVNSHYYIIEAPLPGLFMLPFVAILGARASQEFVCVLCAAIAVARAANLFEATNDFARLAEVDINVGLALKPRQDLLQTAPSAALPLVQNVAEHAYKAGAGLVTPIVVIEGVVIGKRCFARVPVGRFLGTWFLVIIAGAAARRKLFVKRVGGMISRYFLLAWHTDYSSSLLRIVCFLLIIFSLLYSLYTPIW